MDKFVLYTAILLAILVHITTSLPARSRSDEESSKGRKLSAPNLHLAKRTKVPTGQSNIRTVSKPLCKEGKKCKNLQGGTVARTKKQLNFHDDETQRNYDDQDLYLSELNMDYDGDQEKVESNGSVTAQGNRRKRSFLGELFGYPSGYYRRRWWPAGGRFREHHHRHGMGEWGGPRHHHHSSWSWFK